MATLLRSRFPAVLCGVLGILIACGGVQNAVGQVTEPGGGNGTGIAKPPEKPAPLKFGPELKAEVLEKIDNLIDTRCYAAGVDFTKWAEHKAKHQTELDEATTHDKFAAAVTKALGEFGISHFKVQSPRAAAQRNRTSMIGVGVSLKAGPDGLLILSLVPDGPASTSGLKVGDTIIAIDGEKASAPEMLRGEVDTNVEVRVRGQDGHEEEFILTRKQFSTLRKDSLRWVDDETAVLKVNSFTVGYSRDNIAKFIDEAAGKGQNLILDLRNNGGGTTTALNHLLSHLMPGGTPIGTSVSRSIAKAYEKEMQGDSKDAIEISKWSKKKWTTRQRVNTRFEGKVAVLINGGSGSASEITAAALREVRDAVVVGTPSAGAVLVSTFVTLPGGYAMQIPLEDYVTIKGVRLEGNPIVPDVELATPPLALDIDPTEDPVIMRALTELRSRGIPSIEEVPAAKTDPAPEGEPK